MVSSWLKSSANLINLQCSTIQHIEDPDAFKVPSIHEKSTNLLGKKFMTIMKILIGTGLPVSMEQLMIFMNYKNRKTFRELYMHPLMQNNLIKRTIPEKPNAPNQMYLITRKGRLFLGGFDI
jgi:hypothetical protein